MTIDAGDVAPLVTWGTSPDQAIAVTDRVPDPDSNSTADRKTAACVRSPIWA